MSAIMYRAPATYPMPDPEVDRWEARAACRDYDPEWWFPEHGDKRTRKLAVAICSECPVKQNCLDEHQGERYGVFGGKSANQRVRNHVPELCTAPHCDHQAHAKGLCNTHYRSEMRKVAAS
jgi:WhiB family transcriptional regulator, redox-sensing transcriptional regulator